MDALQAVGPPELREALRFVRGRPQPVAADDLARAQGVNRTVARARLERLAQAGLLVTWSERRSGRSGPGAGRPAKLYAPAPETEEIEFPRRPYHELVGLLVDALPARARPARLHQLGVALGRRLLASATARPARDLRAAAIRACAALGALGYQASVEDANGTTVVIATPTCPLRPLVVDRPDLAEVDRGMWCGLVEGALRDVRAESLTCETRNCLDDHASCRVVISLRG